MNNVIRKGVRVRYIGPDAELKQHFGIQTVVQKYGNMAAGYFPTRYSDGKYHSCRYAIPCNELEIVNKGD